MQRTDTGGHTCPTWGGHVRATMCNMPGLWGAAGGNRELNRCCDDLGVWFVKGGREVQEGYIYTCLIEAVVQQKHDIAKQLYAKYKIIIINGKK